MSKPGTRGAGHGCVDRGLLTNLARLVRESTEDLEDYQYTRVLERTETFFWFFCDDYLELVKARRYGDHGEALAASANTALLTALSVLLRLFAPFLPFATEEVWSWWQPGSVHKASWPTEDEILAVAGGADDRGVQALQLAAQVLGAIRKKKSEEQRPLKTPVARIVIRAPERQARAAAGHRAGPPRRRARFSRSTRWCPKRCRSTSNSRRPKASPGRPE